MCVFFTGKRTLDLPHNEVKLKQNSFKTVLKVLKQF